MVSGVDVYPVKSLMDVIHFVNTGNGIAPVKVDGDVLLATLSSMQSILKTFAGSRLPNGRWRSPAPVVTTS
jgi:hypothetical protein